MRACRLTLVAPLVLLMGPQSTACVPQDAFLCAHMLNNMVTCAGLRMHFK
jgi:hypothetical protein